MSPRFIKCLVVGVIIGSIAVGSILTMIFIAIFKGLLT